MAIERNETTTQLVFGEGDIEVAPALLSKIKNEDIVVGAVCFFNNDEGHEVGEHKNYEPNVVIKLEDTPVRMVFTKTESIDVVIWALQETKKMMMEEDKDASTN